MQVPILTPRILTHSIYFFELALDFSLTLISNCIEYCWYLNLANGGDEKSRQRLRALFPDQGILAEWNLSLLHQAVLGLNELCLDTLLGHVPNPAIDQVDSRGRTALFWVAKRGDSSTTYLLLRSGADVNKSTPSGYSPLLAAIESRNQSCIRTILEYGPHITLSNKQGWLPIHLSYYYGSEVDIVESLLDDGINVDVKTTFDHFTPLMLAAQESHLRIIEYLIFRDANLNLTNQDGETALLLIIPQNDPEPISLLLRNGADHSVRSKTGENLLHYAAQFAGVTCLMILHAFDLIGINLGDTVNGTSPIQRMKDIKALTALQIAEKRSDVTPEWKDMFRKLVRGIEHPESKSPIEVIDEIDEFQDAAEQQVE